MDGGGGAGTRRPRSRGCHKPGARPAAVRGLASSENRNKHRRNEEPENRPPPPTASLIRLSPAHIPPVLQHHNFTHHIPSSRPIQSCWHLSSVSSVVPHSFLSRSARLQLLKFLRSGRISHNMIDPLAPLCRHVSRPPPPTNLQGARGARMQPPPPPPPPPTSSSS